MKATSNVGLGGLCCRVRQRHQEKCRQIRTSSLDHHGLRYLLDREICSGALVVPAELQMCAVGGEGGLGKVRWSRRLTQTVKAQFAVRWKFLARQDECTALCTHNGARLVKRGLALPERNLRRNSQSETHPDDERGPAQQPLGDSPYLTAMRLFALVPKDVTTS